MLNIPGASPSSALLSAPLPHRPAQDTSPGNAFARELGRAQAQDSPAPARPVVAKPPAPVKPASAPKNATAGEASPKPPAPAPAPGQAADTAEPAPAPGPAIGSGEAAIATESEQDSESAEATQAAAEGSVATDIASMIAGLLGATAASRAAGGAAAGTRPAGESRTTPDDGAGRTAAVAGRPGATAGETATADGGHGDAPGERKSIRLRGAAAEPAVGPSAGNSTTATSAASPSLAGGAGLQATADDGPPARSATEALPAAAPTAWAGAATATVRHESGVPVAASFEARLSAALGSAEFAPALGQQISVMVSGGVQHARLHLNPAEMGPITVQIALDGNSAQINLAAEQPLTRQALEQAMPALAGALRDSGLTLTGGGVFEQPRDPGRDAANPGPGARASAQGGSDEDSGPAGVAAAPLARTLRGAVDLIA